MYPDPKWPFVITSLIDALAFFQPDNNGVFSRLVDMSLYHSLNIRYILFRSNDYIHVFGASAWNYANDLIRHTEGTSYIGDFDGILVYQVLGGAGVAPFVVFAGSQWYPPEVWSDGQTHRWMTNNASLIIFNPLSVPVTIRLQFVAVSFARQRDIQVYMNKHLLGRLTVTCTERSFNISSIHLKENSQNLVYLYTPQGSESPASLGVSSDNRPLSIAFRNTEVLLLPENHC